MSIRPVKRIVKSTPTMEGAGVKLHRAFGFGDTGEFDPFLLLDDFRNDRPDDYRAGFPWHPHRGIETITYVLAGTVEHGDSLGNSGKMGAGDVQWMTAGSGILHQEMPQGDPQGRMHGFQLWANLPSALKMTAPRYRDIPARRSRTSSTTTHSDAGGDAASSGASAARSTAQRRAALPRRLRPAGPAQDPAGGDRTPRLRLCVRRLRRHFGRLAAVRRADREGDTRGRRADPRATGNRSLVVFDSGDEVTVQAGDEGIRFLLVSGKPIEEPVAWHGPIVMNTNAELQAGGRRAAQRDLHQARLMGRGPHGGPPWLFPS